MDESTAYQVLGLARGAGSAERDAAYHASLAEFTRNPVEMDVDERRRFLEVESAYGFLMRSEAERARRPTPISSLIPPSAGVTEGPAQRVVWPWLLGGGILVAGLVASLDQPQTQTSAALPEPPAVVQDERTAMVPNTYVDWSYDKSPMPIKYKAGALSLTIRGDMEQPDMVAPVVTIEAPGTVPYVMKGSASSPSYAHKIGVGQLRKGDTLESVILQSFTGGAHCCNDIQVVVADAGTFQTIEVGTFDGGPQEEFPKDLNGDGNADFALSDDTFLYAFASYAESIAPPQFKSIMGTKIVDVSLDKAFRPKFAEIMRTAGKACLAPSDGTSPNGACAAFVAAAARIGLADKAWGQMLLAYDRTADWELPKGCSAPVVNDTCPTGSEVTFETYPEALQYFLEVHGYLPRSAWSKTPVAGEPSFDCGKVASSVLKLMCAEPRLAAADVEMAKAYMRTLIFSGDRASLRRDQARFLSLRDGFEWNADGLASLYQERTSQLEGELAD